MEDSNGEFEFIEKSTAMSSSAIKKPAQSGLTNIAPPSELPSFIASPLPPITSATVPPPPLSMNVSKDTKTVSSAISDLTISSPGSVGQQKFLPPPSSMAMSSPPVVASAHSVVSPPSSLPPNIPPMSTSQGVFPSPLSKGISSPIPMVAPPFVSSSQSMVPPPSIPMGAPPAQSSISPPSIPMGLPPSMPPSSTLMSSGPPFIPPNSASSPRISPQPYPVTSQPLNHPIHFPHAGMDNSSYGAHGGSGPDGWLGWFKGTMQSVSHRVAEKAKNSMDTMITTLDPQMKDFITSSLFESSQSPEEQKNNGNILEKPINCQMSCIRNDSGGDVDIIVASDKENKISPVREAFQRAFGKATVRGVGSLCSNVAAQPVGFEAALKGAEERINNLRSSGNIHPQQPVIAVEGFIVELVPQEWFELSLLLLDDPWHDVVLQLYSQVTPVPMTFIDSVKAATPDNYPLKETGFLKTIGQAASESLHVSHTMWQENLTTVSRRDMIYLAARSLSGLYKSRLPNNVI